MLLRKAKKSIVALIDFKAAIEHNSGDIMAIEQFTKNDVSMAKALETKRQKLKVEHDHMSDRLNQMVANLSAEERACERISVQVIEGIEQRRQMMTMWTAAVENLRQRDTDIRHVREDYAVLEEEATKIAEECREQQTFCQQQKANNAEAAKANAAFAAKMGTIRMSCQKLVEYNVTLDSEVKSLTRVLSNMQSQLEKLHMENRRIMDMQHLKDRALSVISQKLQELKEKLADSNDKTKSSEKRAKELEQMLNEEERYATQMTANEQRAMHCSFIEQQKLLALTNEEKLFKIQLKALKTIMGKLDAKEVEFERKLQTQKESLYIIVYQVETIGARVAHMEGAQAERECNDVLVQKEERLKRVCSLHAARVALLERHSTKLHDDMRKYARDLELKGQELEVKKSRLKTAILNVEGGEKDIRSEREAWRNDRVEEALMRLRVTHSTRAVAGYDDTAFSLDKQRLQLEAAMNERLVEIAARRDLFMVQKNALIGDCGKLRVDIRERQQRIEQLMKRYEIFINSLGKDESGQQVSVAYFKIKFAAERAELRERGAQLDAEIAHTEADVSALEATMRVVAAAHHHFMHHISPLNDESEEMQEVYALTKEYYEKRDELKALRADIADLEERVNVRASRLASLNEKCKQLAARESEADGDLEAAKERLSRQEMRLANAKDIVKHNAKRAKKLIEGYEDWRMFQLCMWIRDYTEAAHSSLHAIYDACCKAEEPLHHFASLLTSVDLKRYIPKSQRRLELFIDRILNETSPGGKQSAVGLELERSVFSSSSSSVHSGVSLASGYTRRFCGFRKHLAERVQEPVLLQEVPQQARRSTVSLKLVTLGMEESFPTVDSSRMLSQHSRKGLR
ncbi:coiled-coil domain-containing protein 39-like isoform X2 [Hyposmocoma kahamanoa]|uniref:coiled-coil domain-containing protein 39-like isoform X2 n=1 Tax=Hyposmocoma kahamanoa TaxID=1477025 RepID=UPI000E6D8EF9|nr:coiled-coil domain-containing protein 39-like isoform X2 [Hyposmocoma kahamanoa]